MIHPLTLKDGLLLSWLKFLFGVAVTLIAAVAYLHTFFVSYRQYATDVTAIRSSVSRIEGMLMGGEHLKSENKIVERAWGRALRLAHTTPLEAAVAVVPDVRVFKQKAFLPNHYGGVDRVCGSSQVYIVEEPKGRIRLRSNVLLFRGDAPIEKMEETMVHEFLHYLWALRAEADPSFYASNHSSEEWVSATFPTVCDIE